MLTTIHRQHIFKGVGAGTYTWTWRGQEHDSALVLHHMTGVTTGGYAVLQDDPQQLGDAVNPLPGALITHGAADTIGAVSGNQTADYETYYKNIDEQITITLHVVDGAHDVWVRLVN